MVSLTALWLPILLSAVFVFLVSSVVHMVLPIHKGDFQKLPDEDSAVAGLARVAPGDYAYPCPGSMKEMGSPEMIERYNKGPVGFLHVLPAGPPQIGKALLQWFIYCIVIGVFIAYVAGLGLAPGTDYLKVFQMTGAVAVLVHASSNVTTSMWKGGSWTTTWKFVFDGVLYGLTTAGTFAWLWPDAA